MPKSIHRYECGFCVVFDTSYKDAKYKDVGKIAILIVSRAFKETSAQWLDYKINNKKMFQRGKGGQFKYFDDV